MHDSYRTWAVFLALIFTTLFISGNVFSAKSPKIDENRFALQREDMVKDQIEKRGITDPAVLAAMRKVRRHLFVPESVRDLAYADQPVPIGEGQTISQPFVVGLMTYALKLKKSHKVLEIGTGSGYQAAILAELARTVYSVEIIKPLGEHARELLNRLGYKNIYVKIGDGYQGWKANAPYDAIIVTCSPTHVPQALKDQLADGGRMIIPVGEYPSQELILLKKINHELTRQTVIPVQFVPMLDKDGIKY